MSAPSKKVIRATYESHCPWCDETIYEDDEIARDPDGGDWRPWGLAVRYASDVPIAARTDSVANRMFADIAWKVACYLDAFSSAMSAAEPEAADRLTPWFLRRGVLQWPADGEKTAR